MIANAKDDIEILKAAIDYLRRWQYGQSQCN